MVQLYDHRNEPIDMAALREQRGGATVSGVRSVFPSLPSRIPRPEIMASILREAETPGDGSTERYVDLAEIMLERDPHFMGVMQTRQRGISQLPIAVEPASDAAADVHDAELVDTFFKREDVEDELFDILDSIVKGYSVTEIILGDLRAPVDARAAGVPASALVRVRSGDRQARAAARR